MRIDHDMAFDSRDLFAGVVALAFRAVRIFDTLRIDDAKRRLLAAPKADAGRANLIFLMSAPADSVLLPMASHSICENTSTPQPISGNRSAASATGICFSVRTARRKIFRRDRFALASSFCAHSPGSAALFKLLAAHVAWVYFSHPTNLRIFSPRGKKIVNRLSESQQSSIFSLLN